MSDSKFTPGPWLVEDERDGTFSVWTRQPHTGTLATVHDEDINGEYPAKANAKLIAAAPDLLEAINGMLLHIREPESEAEFQWPDHFKRQKDAFIAARSAIRKATA